MSGDKKELLLEQEEKYDMALNEVLNYFKRDFGELPKFSQESDLTAGHRIEFKRSLVLNLYIKLITKNIQRIKKGIEDRNPKTEDYSDILIGLDGIEERISKGACKTIKEFQEIYLGSLDKLKFKTKCRREIEKTKKSQKIWSYVVNAFMAFVFLIIGILLEKYIL